MTDWLPEEHLVWFVLDAVDLLDLSAFHAKHPNDGVGRRAYDPAMMVSLLIYTYCVGMRSSRKIASACRSDLALKVICADVVPAHDAIGEFRAVHHQAIEDLFVDVLALCAQAGIASLGTIAIDGTKIGANAALDANRSAMSIRAEVERILAEADQTDTIEGAQQVIVGDPPAVEVPRGSRRARLEAALAEIEAQQRAQQADNDARAAKAAAEADEGRKLRGRKPKDPGAAHARAETDVRAAQHKLSMTRGNKAIEAAQKALMEAEARLVATGEALAHATPPPDPVANTTDAQSRIMKTAAGWLQGYNAQAAVNEHQVVIAADVTQDHNDSAQLIPMMTRTAEMIAAAGITGTIGTVLADAGYWSDANATAPGPDRLIATTKDWKQRQAARALGTTTGPPPQDASPLEAMEHRLRTQHGAAVYATRSCTVEPVFGQTKENRSMRRFMRRGLDAARSEWALICATGNLLKLYTHANGRTLAETLATP